MASKKTTATAAKPSATQTSATSTTTPSAATAATTGAAATATAATAAKNSDGQLLNASGRPLRRAAIAAIQRTKEEIARLEQNGEEIEESSDDEPFASNDASEGESESVHEEEDDADADDDEE